MQAVNISERLPGVLAGIRSAIDTGERGLISPEDAAALCGVSRRTIDRQTAIYRRSGGKLGIGPVYQMGRRTTRIPRAAVSAWVEQFRRLGDAPSVHPII